MYTEDHDDLLQAADDDAADTERHHEECLDSAEHCALNGMHDRADDQKSKQHAEEQGQERRHDEVDDVRNDFLQESLKLRGNDAQHESRKNRALIANDRNLDAKHIHQQRLLSAARDGSPCVRKLRSHQHEAEHQTDDRRAAELLHRGPADQSRQEDEGRVREHLAHGEDIPAELHAQGLACSAQAHEKTCCNENRDDRDEHIAQRTGNLLHERHLLIGRFLVARAGQRRIVRDERRADLVHKARAKDDLILLRREELAFDTLDVLDGLFVDQGLVVDNEAQARRAMLRRTHVAHAAHIFLDELRHALLIRQIVILAVTGCRSFCAAAIRLRSHGLSIQLEGNAAVLIVVGHHHRGCRVIARGGDSLRVELQQKLPLRDLVALRSLCREMLALQIDRVHAYMDKKLNAVLGLEADGMLGLEEHRDLAVKRCINLALRIPYRRAASHGAARKNGILHILQSNQLTFQRAAQTNVFHLISSPSLANSEYLRMITFGFGCGTDFMFLS